MLSLILLPQIVFAFDKNFKTVNDRVPFEFQHLFDSMKMMIKTDVEKIKFIGICKDLDSNLGILQKEHIYFLMKSELIKNLLEYKHDKVRSFDVTLNLISRIENDLENKSALLTPFSRWVWRSVIAELKHRANQGLISDKSFRVELFASTKQVEAKRFAKYLNYLLPWIDKMLGLSAAEFNALTKEVSWSILNRLNQRSLLFVQLSSTATSTAKITLFNIPSKLLELHPEEIKRARKDEENLSLKEQSELEKNSALEQVQSITPEDLSPLSDDLAKELEDKAP